MGLFLSSIFITFTGISITRTFFITAGTFAATSLYGYITDRDHMRNNAFLLMGLIGLLLAGIINLFLKSSLMETLASIAGVALFIMLTAFDVQRIKLIYTETQPAEITNKKAILGALALYYAWAFKLYKIFNFLRRSAKGFSFSPI